MTTTTISKTHPRDVERADAKRRAALVEFFRLSYAQQCAAREEWGRPSREMIGKTMVYRDDFTDFLVRRFEAAGVRL